MTDFDPTAEAIQAFDDPAQWDRIVPNVPVFLPHQRVVKNPDGSTRVLDVDVARLERIAANMRRRFARDGVALKFLDDHTKDPRKTPQAAQPRILAYGPDARVGNWMGRPAILTTQYICKGALQRLKDDPLPHRSAEFDEDNDIIPAVAMLKIEPWLDMGMIFYRGQHHAYPYEQHGKLLLYMRDDTMPLDPTAPPDAAAPDADFEQKVLACVTKHFPRLGDMHADHAAKKYAAAEAVPPPAEGTVASAPSGTNTASHDGDGKKKDDGQYADPTLLLQYQKVTAENQKTAAELAELKAVLGQIQVERKQERVEHNREAAQLLYAQLEKEGYVLPAREKQLPRLEAMSREQRAEWVQEVRTHYQKDPTGGLVDIDEHHTVYGPSGTTKARPMTREQRDQALQYMSDRNCTWEEAMTAVTSPNGNGRK